MCMAVACVIVCMRMVVLAHLRGRPPGESCVGLFQSHPFFTSA